MATPMVQAQAVHKNFGRLEVLRGIDLEVAPKEVMCIIGPSGSGKSTLLRCVNHLEKIDAGKLSVDGELVGYTQRGTSSTSCPIVRCAARGPRSAWSFRASTSSRT